MAVIGEGVSTNAYAETYHGAADVFMDRFGLNAAQMPLAERPGDPYVPRDLNGFVVEYGLRGLRDHIAGRLETVADETATRIDTLRADLPTYRAAAEHRRLDFIYGLAIEGVLKAARS